MRKTLILTLLLLPVFIFAQELTPSGNQEASKWNVVMFSLENQTERGRNSELQIVIQKSLFSALSAVPYFQLTMTNTEWKKNSFDSTLPLYNKGVDILLYGYYFTEGDKIYISIKALDLVMKTEKFQKTYVGEGGMDIFDTIDNIIISLRGDLTRMVPPMEEEVIVKYRKRTVLVSEEIKMKREFIVGAGVISRIGSNPDLYITMEGNLNRLGFGVNFFFPVLLQGIGNQGWDNALGNFFVGYALSPRIKLYFGTYIAYMFAGYTFQPLNLYLKSRFVIAKPFSIALSAGFSPMATSSGESGLIFSGELRYFFLPSLGVDFQTFYSTYRSPEDSVPMAETKLTLSVLYRVNFD